TKRALPGVKGKKRWKQAIVL
ncbi:hypothetical protein E2320_002691, partial [Naja naja]